MVKQIIEILGEILSKLMGVFLKEMMWPTVPLNVFDALKNLLADNWVFTGIMKIDTPLLCAALFISSVISYFVGKVSKNAAPIIGLLSFVFILVIFESRLFWISIFMLIILVIAFLIITSVATNEVIPKDDNNKTNEMVDSIAITTKTEDAYSIYELWQKNANLPFKAYNTESGIYVYISQDPAKQY